MENLNRIVHVKGDRVGIGYQRRFHAVIFTDQPIEATTPIVYLTSDGYLDQNGGGMNKRYSRQNFIELLQRIQGQDLSTQGDIIKTRVRDI